MNHDLAAYKNLYLETARVYLHNLQEDIEHLKEKKDNTYAISDVYICAHSLKSQSTVMKFTQIATVSKYIEQIFHAHKENTLAVSDIILSVMNDAVFAIGQALESIEKNNTENDMSEIIQKLQTLQYV